jgi:hypothetical protein
MRLFVYIFVLLLTLPCLTQAALYRWVDSAGKVHYGDHVPPEYAEQEKKKLDASGRTIETIERSKTQQELEELRELQRLREEERKQEALRQSKDRMLLLTYQGVDEIVAARDTKVSTLELSIQHALGNRKAQIARLRGVRQSAADFERTSRPIPQSVLDQIKALQTKIAQTDQYIDKKRQEQLQIREEFAGFISRYKELREK